MEVVSFVTV